MGQRATTLAAFYNCNRPAGGRLAAKRLESKMPYGHGGFGMMGHPMGMGMAHPMGLGLGYHPMGMGMYHPMPMVHPMGYGYGYHPILNSLLNPYYGGYGYGMGMGALGTAAMVGSNIAMQNQVMNQQSVIDAQQQQLMAQQYAAQQPPVVVQQPYPVYTQPATTVQDVPVSSDSVTIE